MNGSLPERRSGGPRLIFGIHISSRLVLGIIVIAFGALFLLDNLHVLEMERWIEYWPVALIIVGLLKLVQRGDTPVSGSAIVWILIGSFLLLRNLDLIRLRFRDVVPIALLLFGSAIVWGAIRRHRGTAVVTDMNATVSTFALMAGLERKVISQDFRGGEVTAIMGGAELDLRQSTIGDQPAVIDVFALWGGIGLTVPENWVVVGKVIPLMGGFEDNTKFSVEAGPRKELVIKGMALMGGVEVKNK